MKYVIRQGTDELYTIIINDQEIARCDLLDAEELAVSVEDIGCSVEWVYLEDLIRV